MNIDAYYLRMNPEDLEEIISDVDRLEHLSIEFHDPDILLYLYNYWELLHFVLTDSDSFYTPELAAGNIFSLALIGGQTVGPDLGYGPARYLTPEQVQEISAAIDAVDFDDLVEKITEEDFKEAELDSPEDFEEKMADLKEVYFPDFKIFFQEAAKNNQAVLAYMA